MTIIEHGGASKQHAKTTEGPCRKLGGSLGNACGDRPYFRKSRLGDPSGLVRESPTRSRSKFAEGFRGCRRRPGCGAITAVFEPPKPLRQPGEHPPLPGGRGGVKIRPPFFINSTPPCAGVDPGADPGRSPGGTGGLPGGIPPLGKGGSSVESAAGQGAMTPSDPSIGPHRLPKHRTDERATGFSRGPGEFGGDAV